MQTLIVCLTILACLTATTDWSQYCNGNIIDAINPQVSVQLYLQDPLVEDQPTGRRIARWMQIKPSEQPRVRAAESDDSTIETQIVDNAPKIARRDTARTNSSDMGDAVNRPNSSGSLAGHDVAAVNRALVSKTTSGLNNETKIAKNAGTNVKTTEGDQDKIEASLPQISKMTILHHFNADENDSLKGLSLAKFADKFVVKSEHKKDAGLFITLIKNEDTRACWGSVNSSQRNLVLATVFTTEDALGKDYRYSKIKKSEINQLIPQVTVVKKIIPINSIVTMQPLKQGLMVRAGGKGAVLLPGEASDPHYQLVKTKLKAGIPMSQPCQLYRIEADVYR